VDDGEHRSTLGGTVSSHLSTSSTPISGRARTTARPPGRSARGAALALVIGLALVAATLTTVSAPSPAGAQAAPVQVTSRTEPEIPDPGEDVTVRVRATGCPPGGALVEVYLTSGDGASSVAALMARNEARSTLFFRVRAEVELPDAIEGWYGVRVVCGQFRPARVPMSGTTFRIGVNPTKTMSVSATQVIDGGSFRIDGNGCPGDNVEYSFSQNATHVNPFTPQGALLVNADGTWGGDIIAPPGLLPGRAEIRIRCGLINQFGDQVWINYAGELEIEVLPGPEVTQPVVVRPGA
jgi:hypothetical protein